MADGDDRAPAIRADTRRTPADTFPGSANRGDDRRSKSQSRLSCFEVAIHVSAIALFPSRFSRPMAEIASQSLRSSPERARGPAPHLPNEPVIFDQRWPSATSDPGQWSGSSFAVERTVLVSASICVFQAARLGDHRQQQDAAGRRQRAAPAHGVGQGRSAVLQPGAVLRRAAAASRLNWAPS